MQELDETTPYFDIPEEIREFYKMYRPAPLVLHFLRLTNLKIKSQRHNFDENIAGFSV